MFREILTTERFSTRTWTMCRIFCNWGVKLPIKLISYMCVCVCLCVCVCVCVCVLIRNQRLLKKSLPRCFSVQKKYLPRYFSEQEKSLPRCPPARPRLAINIGHPLKNFCLRPSNIHVENSGPKTKRQCDYVVFLFYFLFHKSSDGPIFI